MVSGSAAGTMRPALWRSLRMTLPSRSVVSGPPRIWLNSWLTAVRSRSGIADLRCQRLVGDGGLAPGRVERERPAGGVGLGNVLTARDGGLEDAAAELVAESFLDGLAHGGVVRPAG